MKHDDTNQNPTNERELGSETLEELSGGMRYKPSIFGPVPEFEFPESKEDSGEPKEGGATGSW